MCDVASKTLYLLMFLMCSKSNHYNCSKCQLLSPGIHCWRCQLESYFTYLYIFFFFNVTWHPQKCGWKVAPHENVYLVSSHYNLSLRNLFHILVCTKLSLSIQTKLSTFQPSLWELKSIQDFKRVRSMHVGWTQFQNDLPNV